MRRIWVAWTFVGFLLSGIVPAQASLVINEVLADPDMDAVLGDANRDGRRDSYDDEFVELVNAANADLGIAGWTVHDGVARRFTFPMETVVPAGASVTLFGGGSPTGIPGLVFVSDAGLGLNNSGDTVTILDDAEQLVDFFSYGAEGGQNQSLTRSPDVIGCFVLHSDAAPDAALFSPGSRTDGTPFVVPLPSALVLFFPAVFTLVPFGRRAVKRDS